MLGSVMATARDRIMIYSPKDNGSYVVEFKTGADRPAINIYGAARERAN
jgi:hypothetical protein